MASRKKAHKLVLTVRRTEDMPAAVSRIKNNISRAPFELVHLEIGDAIDLWNSSPFLWGDPKNETQAWNSFFEELTHLKAHKLVLKGNIPIAGLTNMLQLQEPTLRAIEFQQSFFLGSKAHLQKFMQILREQSHINHLSFNDVDDTRCHWSRDSLIHFEGPNDLMRAVAEMPCLQSLDWVLKPRYRHLDPSSESLEPQSEALEPQFEALTRMSNSGKLRHLEVSFEYSTDHVSLFQSWIRSLKTQPNCALVSLRIKGSTMITNRRDSFVSDQLAEFLTNNQTLEELELPLLSLNSLQPLILALKTNRTLGSLCINALKLEEPPSESLHSDIIAMLKENPVLSMLQARPWKKPKEVQDLLLLNKAGRATLTSEQNTVDYWSNALVTCCRNVTGLYFYLRHNPALLFQNDNKIPALGTVRNPIKAKKRKRTKWY